MTQNARTTTAAMVVVGNEILSGKVVDSNSPFLARELRKVGVALERIVVIPDDVPTIAETVADCCEAFDVVFTSGGVGPTHDDLTIAGVAKAFGKRVVLHPELEATIKRYVGPEAGMEYLKMAEVPEGAELIVGDESNFPTVSVANAYILPGIPEIFEAKVRALSSRFASSPFHLRQVLVSANESRIAEYLNATLEAFPELMLGSYPKLSNPEYSVRLTLESKDEAYLESALEDLIGRMPAGYVVRVER
jgi:molybdenum cofactor synthesis domain-containing protein